MKRLMLIACSLLLGAASALAVATAPYRIALRDGRQILAKDRPIQSGSVLLYHPYPHGVLTGVPVELVAGINAALATGTTEVSSIKVLNPGDTVVLGPTGAGQAAPAAGYATVNGGANGANGAVNGANATGVYNPNTPGMGGNAATPANGNNVLGLTPNGDLARAQSGPPPTAQSPVAGSGFQANPASPPPVIAPNGQPVINPGAPGSAPPVTGPNGTPTLAPPGSPGSAPPAIGPNGYPILTNPNGTNTNTNTNLNTNPAPPRS